MTHRKPILSFVLATSCLLVIIVWCYHNEPTSQPERVPFTVAPVDPSRVESSSSTGRSLALWTEDEEEAMVAKIREKIRPVNLLSNEDKVLEPHQALHLHHMKTGGTSLDHLLKCARERLQNDLGYTVDHFSIHECARMKFRNCVANADDPCRAAMDHAATMSFCSALKHLNRFGWDDTSRIRAFTILRHPVERVWSMFRFETRMCYHCQNLTDIYDMIDSGDSMPGYDYLCLQQLQNHQTANLLTSDWPQDASDDDILAEAIENMKSFFTVIGLTEELTMTMEIIGTAFPWINKTIEGSQHRCSLPHDNSSPQNNHCIRNPRKDGKPGFITTHWDLPNQPDDATRTAIEKHNQLDIKLYEAAVQYFELQKRAFQENEEAS